GDQLAGSVADQSQEGLICAVWIEGSAGDCRAFFMSATFSLSPSCLRRQASHFTIPQEDACHCRSALARDDLACSDASACRARAFVCLQQPSYFLFAWPKRK